MSIGASFPSEVIDTLNSKAQAMAKFFVLFESGTQITTIDFPPLSLEIQEMEIDVDGNEATAIRSCFTHNKKRYECLTTHNSGQFLYVLCYAQGNEPLEQRLRIFVISPNGKIYDPEGDPEGSVEYFETVTRPQT